MKRPADHHLDTANGFGLLQTEPIENVAFYDQFPQLGYLRGYEDADLFMRKLTAPNRFFKVNPDIRLIADKAVDGDKSVSIEDAAELINISREIDSPINERPVNKIFSYISMLKELSEPLTETGRETDKEIWHRYFKLLDCYTDDLVRNIPENELVDYLQTVNFVVQRLGRERVSNKLNNFSASWISYRIQNISKSILERFDQIDYVNELPQSETDLVSPEQAERDSKEIAALFVQARSNQTYGVKLAYKPKATGGGSYVFTSVDSMLDELNSSVKIEEAPDAERTARGLVNLKSQSVAYVVDSDKTEFKKGVRYKFKLDSSLQVQAWDNLGGINGEVGINQDGELIGSFGTSTELLRDVAVRNGRYDSYRKLQAEIIGNYLDLTCPIDETDVSHTKDYSDAENDLFDNQKEEIVKDEALGVDVVRSMLLRRIKKNNAKGKGVSIEGSREVRLHGVVWHIRKLPQGWKPSSRAQDLAQEAGIVLADNETFVSDHQRGSKRLGEVVMHKLVRRNYRLDSDE